MLRAPSSTRRSERLIRDRCHGTLIPLSILIRLGAQAGIPADIVVRGGRGDLRRASRSADAAGRTAAGRGVYVARPGLRASFGLTSGRAAVAVVTRSRMA